MRNILAGVILFAVICFGTAFGSDSAEQCASLNSLTGVLHIPCFKTENTLYWVDLQIGTSSLEIKDYAADDTLTSSTQCASFDLLQNTFHIPCFYYDGKSYTIDLNLPVSFSVKDFNEADKADTTPPVVPTGVKIAVISTSEISLSWNAMTDDVGVAGYKVYKQGSYYKTVSATQTTDKGLVQTTQYCYQVSAYDAAGNESGLSSQACAKTSNYKTDTTPPSIPAGLTASLISSEMIILTWNASTDDVAVAGYRIYSGGNFIKTISATSASMTGLLPSTQYCYTVSAYDYAGNESEQSSQFCTTTAPPDTAPPSIPTGLTATAISLNEIKLYWSASTDDVFLEGYKVYWYNSSVGIAIQHIQTVTTTSASMKGLNPLTYYCFMVSALDSAGNESGNSMMSCATTLGPQTPIGLKAATVTTTSINLSWDAVADIKEYKVYDNRYSNPIQSTEATSVSITGLTPSTEYCYSVSALDAAGNESSKSNYLCIKTLGLAVPTGLTITTASTDSIGFSWTITADNSGITGYKVYQNGSYILSTTSTSVVVTGLSPSTKDCYTVTSYDSAGNESSQSNEVCATTSGLPAPTGLRITAVTRNKISLAWDAQPYIVSSYKIYRNGISYASLSDIYYSDFAVSPMTRYCYSVSSVDVNSRESLLSSQECVATFP